MIWHDGLSHHQCIDTIWYKKPSSGVTKAELLFHQRIEYDDGAIAELALWRVSSPVRPSMHGLK